LKHRVGHVFVLAIRVCALDGGQVTPLMTARICIFQRAWLALLSFSEMFWPVRGLLIGVDELTNGMGRILLVLEGVSGYHVK
jgi:hypothetical protein